MFSPKQNRFKRRITSHSKIIKRRHGLLLSKQNKIWRNLQLMLHSQSISLLDARELPFKIFLSSLRIKRF